MFPSLCSLCLIRWVAVDGAAHPLLLPSYYPSTEGSLTLHSCVFIILSSVTKYSCMSEGDPENVATGTF